jgi:branched-chain amino acid transport system substrate-binding protein
MMTRSRSSGADTSERVSGGTALLRRPVLPLLMGLVLILVACGEQGTTQEPTSAPGTTDDGNGTAPAQTEAPQSSVESIRIGLLFPTTGGMGFLGTDQANGVKLVLEWANDNGGVNGVPIEIFEADSQSDAGVGATEAQRLIDQHDVDIIIGSYASGIAQAASPVAERNGVIYWEIGAVANALSQQGYQNFIRTVGIASTYAEADIDFLVDYMAPQLGKEPGEMRIAIAHENGPFGSSVADALEAIADEQDLNVVIREPYAEDSTDLTPLVLRLKDAEPDVLYIVPLPGSTILFWDQARAQDFNVSAVIGSAGFSSPSFIERFGAEGIEGAMVVEAPAVAHMNTDGLDSEVGELLEQLLAEFEERYGHECLVHCGDGLGGAHILVADVLPRALSEYDSVDAEAIRQAADATDIPDGGTLQGFGAQFAPVDADNAGDNVRARSYIMQWQDGSLRVVWPEGLAVADPQFPMPTWSERE